MNIWRIQKDTLSYWSRYTLQVTNPPFPCRNRLWRFLTVSVHLFRKLGFIIYMGIHFNCCEQEHGPIYLTALTHSVNVQCATGFSATSNRGVLSTHNPITDGDWNQPVIKTILPDTGFQDLFLISYDSQKAHCATRSCLRCNSIVIIYHLIF